MKKWDYMIVTLPFSKGENIDMTVSAYLKEYGKRGWELVSERVISEKKRSYIFKK